MGSTLTVPTASKQEKVIVIVVRETFTIISHSKNVRRLYIMRYHRKNSIYMLFKDGELASSNQIWW